jgi:hypothetical protein
VFWLAAAVVQFVAVAIAGGVIWKRARRRLVLGGVFLGSARSSLGANLLW